MCTGNNYGLSLTEVVVVIVIMLIIATMSIPTFIRTSEHAKAKEAVSTLHQIRHGEIIYRGDNNTFWPAGATESNVANINAKLRVYLDTLEPNWDYYVKATKITFTATAKRQTGTYGGQTITLDENGKLGGTWSGPGP